MLSFIEILSIYIALHFSILHTRFYLLRKHYRMKKLYTYMTLTILCCSGLATFAAHHYHPYQELQQRCETRDSRHVYRVCNEKQEQTVVDSIIKTLIPELMSLDETYENNDNSLYVLQTLSQYLRKRIEDSRFSDQRFIYEVMHFYTQVVIDSGYYSTSHNHSHL